MTEGEENIIIKGVLLEAISRDFSEELSNNKEVSVSPRFKRQMMAMMNNPNKWAERHKRDYRRRFVKVVATIVLTCSLPFGVLTVASPTVRAAVIDWVVEAERGCFYEEENYTAILSGAVAGDCHDSDLCCN